MVLIRSIYCQTEAKLLNYIFGIAFCAGYNEHMYTESNKIIADWVLKLEVLNLLKWSTKQS